MLINRIPVNSFLLMIQGNLLGNINLNIAILVANQMISNLIKIPLFVNISKEIYHRDNNQVINIEKFLVN